MNESKLLSLGMQRINGSMKAENAVLIIYRKVIRIWLQPHRTHVGMVTDGAAIVEKTSRLSEALHQICHFHGIHLTVVDALCKTKWCKTNGIHLTVIDALCKTNNAGKHLIGRVI